jgi:hypothetical protein
VYELHRRDDHRHHLYDVDLHLLDVLLSKRREEKMTPTLLSALTLAGFMLLSIIALSIDETPKDEKITNGRKTDKS